MLNLVIQSGLLCSYFRSLPASTYIICLIDNGDSHLDGVHLVGILSHCVCCSPRAMHSVSKSATARTHFGHPSSDSDRYET